MGDCQRALDSLKCFSSLLPHAFVCAAGSNIGLLASLRVAAVRTLELFPLCFEELLMAGCGRELLDALSRQDRRTSGPPTSLIPTARLPFRRRDAGSRSSLVRRRHGTPWENARNLGNLTRTWSHDASATSGSTPDCSTRNTSERCFRTCGASWPTANSAQCAVSDARASLFGREGTQALAGPTEWLHQWHVLS